MMLNDDNHIYLNDGDANDVIPLAHTHVRLPSPDGASDFRWEQFTTHALDYPLEYEACVPTHCVVHSL